MVEGTTESSAHFAMYAATALPAVSCHTPIFKSFLENQIVTLANYLSTEEVLLGFLEYGKKCTF